jgi:hypothetical protein
VLGQVGTIDEEHLSHSAALLAAFPAPLRAAANEPFGAVATLYALLVHKEPALRRDQLALLGQHLPATLLQETVSLLVPLDAMDPALRLPLADLMLPALRQLSDAQIATVEEVMGLLARADGQIDLFEFVLERLMRRRLDVRLGKAMHKQNRFRRLRDVMPDAELSLAVLADAGHDDGAAAALAWNRAVAQLRGLTPASSPLPVWQLADLDAALERLAAASPAIKKQFLEASVSCVLDDGYLAIAEAELLRLFAHSLGLPMPPLIEPQVATLT